MATLADLQNRLARVRSKERGFIAIQGVCRVLVALIIVVIAYFLLDWFVDLPYNARLAAAGAGVLFVGYVFYRYLIVELRKIQDDDEMALRVESRNPDLRGRLISTLQLIRTKKAGVYAGSDELIAALEDETVRMSDPLDFASIISTAMLKRLLIAAAIVVLVKAVLIFEFPEYFKALAGRLYNPEMQYPTKTRIKGDVKVPEFVPRGDDIPVEVTLEPQTPRPAAGVLHFINERSNTNVPVELVYAEGETYRGKLTKALEDVDLVVEIGDVRTKRRTIRVVARPEVDTSRSAESVHFTLPEYTKEPSPPPAKFGAISVLQGSTAQIQFTATKPLKSAVIKRSDGREYPMKAVPAPEPKDAQTPKESEGMTWRVSDEFKIEKSGTFHVELIDENNLANGKPVLEYPIDARPDLAPSIKLLKPNRDATVTPTARPIIKYNAHDDYGVRVVWLCYKIRNENLEPARSDGKFEEEKKIPTQKREYKIDLDPETKKIRRELLGATITWDLSELKVKVGDQIILWLECDDYCETNDDAAVRKTKDGEIESKYPRTQDVKLTVISRQDKEAELRAELARLNAQIELHAKKEEEDKTKVMDIMESLNKLLKEK